MNRLIQIITGSVNRKNDEGLSRRNATRRSVACRPGLEAMELRLSLSTVGFSAVGNSSQGAILARIPGPRVVTR
jgi:hypothetical protein